MVSEIFPINKIIRHNITQIALLFGQVVDWIVGPGEKLLASQVDIGNSLSEADQLRREHEKLELKCTVSMQRNV